MDCSLNFFLEEFNKDQIGSNNKVGLFKTRLLRRIKRFAIVDVEYLWENSEVLNQAKSDISSEMDTMLEILKGQEEYELCQIVKDSGPQVNKIYNTIYSDKMRQVKNARIDETVEE